jgi:uncharacterized protein YjdB
MRSRKFLCAVLALVMAVSLCVPAFAAAGVAVNSVKIDNKPASGQLDVAAGDSTQLTATVSYTFNNLPMTSTAVTWSSANTGVATIDELGNITAVGVGTTVMTATAVADTAKSDTITIRIVPTVTVSPASLGVCVGGTKTLTASAAPAGTYTYTWSSSDAAIAAVSGNGAAAVVTGVSEGAADITVTAAANGVESAPAACAVTVYPDAAGIAIHDASGADITGLTTTPGQLTCVTTPAEAVNGGTVAWKSSDPAVATVDETGKVTAVGTGTANITCTFTGGTVKTAACSVEVKYSEAKQADAVYVSAVYGKETSMNGAYSDISSKFAALCGSAPASDAKISFYNFTNTCGTLHGSSGTVTDGSSCAFSELKTMIFTPTGIGTETVYYTLSSYPDQMTGSIVVTVTSTSSLVTVNLDNTDPYTFSAATVKDNASAAGQIRDAVYAASGGDYSYIVFGAENTAAGTLYSRENGGRVGTADKFLLRRLRYQSDLAALFRTRDLRHVFPGICRLRRLGADRGELRAEDSGAGRSLVVEGCVLHHAYELPADDERGRLHKLVPRQDRPEQLPFRRGIYRGHIFQRRVQGLFPVRYPDRRRRRRHKILHRHLFRGDFRQQVPFKAAVQFSGGGVLHRRGLHLPGRRRQKFRERDAERENVY